MPRTITKAYIRTHNGTGRSKAYVEWDDGSRTEGYCRHLGGREFHIPASEHIGQLLDRAARDGITIEHETF